MIIIPIKITWDSADAKVLRDFLETPVGQKMVQYLHSQIPTLLDGGDVNKTLVRSGEVKGAQSLFDSFVNLVVESPAELQPPQKTIDSYPSLDIEEAWEELSIK
jgi:hypothetical protein